MENKCKDCKRFSEGLLCCMNEYNEGRRIWNKNENACKLFEKGKIWA